MALILKSSNLFMALPSFAAGLRFTVIESEFLAIMGPYFESSEKAAQFIQLCNQIDVPLLFLHNITGYMVGTAFEQGGITKNGSKMINAVSNSTVPHITIILAASYGETME